MNQISHCIRRSKQGAPRAIKWVTVLKLPVWDCRHGKIDAFINPSGGIDFMVGCHRFRHLWQVFERLAGY
ncbi:hypothetical protein Lepto7375DRAFT_2550 [Leptolyngbya sp. PCC 7375]|nr:hypothetical protein Lepto7375DRAFT_2550 [Leptolyngbya sp. PCC 7375]